MAPSKPSSALIKGQFISLGRPASLPGTDKKRSPRYRCKHCQWVGAASSPSRLNDHLRNCSTYQAALPSQPEPDPSLSQKQSSPRPARPILSPTNTLPQSQQLQVNSESENGPVSLAHASLSMILAAWHDNGGMQAARQEGLPIILTRVRATVLPTQESPVRKAIVEQLDIFHRTILAISDIEDAVEEPRGVVA